MRWFDGNGCLRIGKHKGTPARQIPSGWLSWAHENLRGFSAELEIASRPREKKDDTGKVKYNLAVHERHFLDDVPKPSINEHLAHRTLRREEPVDPAP